MRFLDRTSLPPFIAAIEVYKRNPVCAPDDVALFTVSGWDPAVPDPPFAINDSLASLEQMSRFVYETVNPTRWLRGMSNNALCQAAIAGGFRGPNAHFVGGSSSLWQTLVLARQTLHERAAELTIVVAYDAPPVERREIPGQAHTGATAIGLMLSPNAAIDAGALIDNARALASARLGAVDVLEHVIELIDEASPAPVSVASAGEF
jgi:hypothetical protein